MNDDDHKRMDEEQRAREEQTKQLLSEFASVATVKQDLTVQNETIEIK